MKHSICLAFFLFPLTFANAEANPIQPWSGYKVHDMERPFPEKVKTKGAVTVAAPKDAIILFDGEDTSAFLKPWPVKDGVMVASKGGNLLTKEKFADCQVHLEWRVPAGRKVEGQIGGNSGIFLMNLYEIQIQESHTNVTYPDGQAAAIYGQHPPLKNASSPQGEWQSYDIIFKAPIYNEDGVETPAYITVIHNGVVVHHAQELQGPTKGRKITPYPKTHADKAPIRLQWHKDPIEFRNFWVRKITTQKKK